MWYSGAGGKLIHEKNQKQKIFWHCPFKGRDQWEWGGRENDKWSEYAWDRGDQRAFVF
jgi:hypothetical protein